MTGPTPHRRLRELFESAAELEPGRRTAFLMMECGGDGELRDQVAQLLRIDAGADEGLPSIEVLDANRQLFDDAWGSINSEITEAPVHPEKIGRYRLIEVLGEGATATVFRAEQDQPRRHVALKILKRIANTGPMLRRFEQEVEVLGELEHPGIARVYDAWVVVGPTGLVPYFAMELVDGADIESHVRSANAPTRQRIELIIDVCDAISHAHQRGIVHRDLKPGNILVGADGKPKVVDFGIARVVRQTGEQATAVTGVGELLGTIAYMSPEQLTGRPEQVGTPADVYALGVVLYELLSGTLPFDLDELPIADAIQLVREGEPHSLSKRMASVDRDLVAIVSKATAREVDRRYGSVNEFRADLHRYLEGEPVTARAPTLTYVLGRYSRRHRGAVLSALLIGVSLVAVAVVALLSAQRERSLRNQSEMILAFFTEEIIAAASPTDEEQRGVGATTGETLRHAAERLATESEEGRFDDYPYVAASINLALARAFRSLADYEAGLQHSRDATDLFAAAGRRYALQADDARVTAAECLVHLRETAAAKELLDALDLIYADSHDGEGMALEFRVAMQLGQLADHQMDTEVARVHYERALDIADALEDPIRISRARVGLITVSLRERNADEALISARLEYERLIHEKGPESIDTVQAMLALAQAFQLKSMPDEAADLLRSNVPIITEHFGADHIAPMTGTGMLASVLLDMDKPNESRPLVEQARAYFDSEMPDSAYAHWIHTVEGRVMISQGRYAEATEHASALIASQTEAYGADDRRVVGAQITLAEAFIGLGEFDEGEAELRSALETAVAAELDQIIRFKIMSELADLAETRGDFEQALEEHMRVYERRVEIVGSLAIETIRSAIDVCECLEKLDRSAEAIEFGERVLDAVEGEYAEDNGVVARLAELIARLKASLGER